PRGEWGSESASRSSRDLPGGAVLGVLQHDAHGGKLIADAIGLFEVLFLASGIARCDQSVDRSLVKIGPLLPKHGIEVDRRHIKTQKLAARPEDCSFLALIQAVEFRDDLWRIQIIAKCIENGT